MSAAPASQPGHGLLDQAGTIRSQFERTPFTVNHRLCEHPLLQLPRLIQLASALPATEVEFNHADIPLNQDYLKTPQNGLSIADTLYQMEHCNSWMVLKHVELDAAYRQLLQECVEPLRPYTESVAPGMCVPQAFIFISSPRAVTPYHCDPEHNFLLQIRGSKTVAVFDRDDAAAVTQLLLEDKVNGAHRNLPFNEALRDRARLFHLTPGTGVHVPMHSPHWVRVDDAVSVSFSITFRSRFTWRREAVLRFNSRLRRLGVAPAKPGDHGVKDELKYFAERVLGRVKRIGSG